MTDSTDNARGPELLPCPFCGAKDGLVTHSVARGVYVECKDGCGAYGPDADNGNWNMRRADLAPNPLGDPRVVALVEALTIIDALDPEGMINGCSQSALTGIVLRMGETARAALAAISPTGGNDE